MLTTELNQLKKLTPIHVKNYVVASVLAKTPPQFYDQSLEIILSASKVQWLLLLITISIIHNETVEP
jgi:hypothetical protein